MGARSELVTLLEATLPADIDVIAYAHNIDAPTNSTVMVRVDSVAPGPSGWVRLYTFGLVLIAAKTTHGPADDELDGLLEDVLAALSSNALPNGVTWTAANRAAYGEPDPTNPAYEVTVTVAAQIEQE